MENTVLLKAIIDNAIDGLITIDDRGIIESINPSACQLFSYTEQEVVGKNISMLMPQPDRAHHDGYLFRYKKTGDANIIGIGRELIGMRKNGSQFPFRLGVSEVKYSGEESSIQFYTKINENNCTIRICDNGIGIPLEDQKHLCEPFFRAHNTGKISGNGLGLSILSRYTDLMNGKVDFKSRINRGTLFTLTFPQL